MPLSEFQIIQNVFDRPAKRSEIRQSIGDDCAVVTPPEGHELVFSMDTLVADVHFPRAAPAEWIGYRALAVCVSDLAAMGATPSHFTLGITIPDGDENWIKHFANGLFEAADRFEMDLVGGDTTRGPLTINIQVHGWVEKGKALLRNGAVAGDWIFLSHFIGDSAAVLSQVLNNPHNTKPEAYYRPKPRITLGQELIGVATSCLDLSDGLLGDLDHVCKLSGVGAEISMSLLPISASTMQSVGEHQAHILALTGGDDYELCFTVGPDDKDKARELLAKHNLAGRCIGQITMGDRVIVLDDDKNEVDIDQHSYQHFYD